MKRAFLIGLILIVFSSAKAQMKINYGAEIGINFTSLPQTFYEDSHEKKSEYSLPGLIAGCSMNTVLANHIVFSFGVQYRKMNNYCLAHFNFSPNTIDYHINEHYAKINFPLTTGVQFGKRLHPAIFIGAEMNYIILGKIDIKNIFSNEVGGVTTVETKTAEKNTFDEYEFSNQSRLRGQGIFGFSMSLSKHFQIGTTLHIGGPIEGVFHMPPESTIYEVDYGSVSTMYWNHEFSISLNYFFKELYNSPSKKTLE